MQSHEGPLGNVGTAPCASLAISYVLSTEHTIPNDSACATTNSKASFRPSGRVFPYIVTHVRLLCRCTVDAIKYLLCVPFVALYVPLGVCSLMYVLFDVPLCP